MNAFGLPIGDLLKAMAEVTELKRAVLIMNSRLEENTRAMDRNSSATEELRDLLKRRAVCPLPPQS